MIAMLIIQIFRPYRKTRTPVCAGAKTSEGMSVTIDATGLKAWVVSFPNQHHARTPDRTAGTIVRLKDQKFI